MYRALSEDYRRGSQRGTVVKRRLNALEANLSTLKVKCASLRRAQRELAAKEMKLGEDLQNGLKEVSQQSIDGVAQMAEVFEV